MPHARDAGEVHACLHQRSLNGTCGHTRPGADLLENPVSHLEVSRRGVDPVHLVVEKLHDHLVTPVLQGFLTRNASST